jgi:hypothetical protein
VSSLFLASVEVRCQRSNELGLVHLIPLFTRKVKRSLNVFLNLRSEKRYLAHISRCVAIFQRYFPIKFFTFYA